MTGAVGAPDAPSCAPSSPTTTFLFFDLRAAGGLPAGSASAAPPSPSLALVGAGRAGTTGADVVGLLVPSMTTSLTVVLTGASGASALGTAKLDAALSRDGTGVGPVVPTITTVFFAPPPRFSASAASVAAVAAAAEAAAAATAAAAAAALRPVLAPGPTGKPKESTFVCRRMFHSDSAGSHFSVPLGVYAVYTPSSSTLASKLPSSMPMAKPESGSHVVRPSSRSRAGSAASTVRDMSVPLAARAATALSRPWPAPALPPSSGAE